MNPSPEFRRCPVAGHAVVLAPQRADRPMTLPHAEPHPRDRRPNGPCPFCPGAEEETPPELFAVRDDQGWQLRVVPNKFPAVDPNAAAFGFHEVFIESRNHVSSPTELTDAEFANVFTAYRERLLHHAADPRVEAVCIFKNVGAEAGASLAHVHSQLVALPFVPEGLQRRLDSAAGLSPSPLEGEGGGGGSRPGAKGGNHLASAIVPTPHPNPPPQGGREPEAASCHLCRLGDEPARVVAESPHFRVVCPFAPRFAYEMWALPKAHRPRFETIEHVAELAALMKRCLLSLDRVLQLPAYNWMLHTAPRGDHPQFHWHVEIIPRLSRVAGFEWGSGVFINDTFPERAAAALRDRLTA